MIKRSILFLTCLQLATHAVATNAEQVTDNAAVSLDSMVVTTRKREEVLQEVPVAITAFSSQEIKDANIQNIEDVALLTPGLTFLTMFGDLGNPVIRGLNTTIGEPNVGIFLDGVYQESRSAMTMLLGDEIERIEVAKGPQSALFGRNTFGGAINYISRQPGNDNGGQLELTLGNKGRKEARLAYSGALTEDTLFFRVGAMHTGFDGFYQNEATGGDLDSQQTNAVSLSLLAIPRDDMEMTLRIAYEDSNDGDRAVRFIPNNAYGPLPIAHPVLSLFNQPQLLTGNVPGLTSGYAVTPGYHNRDNLAVSFKLDWDFDTVTLTSITGYNHLRLDYALDTDYSVANVQFTKEKTGQTEFSQEFRLTSVDQPIRWMAGIYFYNLDRDYRQHITGSGAVNLFTQEGTKNWAGFGSVGFDLTQKLALTLEGRYAYERKKVSVANIGQPPAYADHAVFNHFVPKVSLDYTFNQDMMAYASVAKAVKSGGFNTAINGTVPLPSDRKYNEEKSWNYELGLKSSWLNQRLTTNIAVFYIDWKDQIARSIGSNLAILNDNVGKASSRGFELEVAAKPAKNWAVSAGLTYTHAKYDRYTFNALPLFGLDPVLDGNPMQYVADWTANTSVQYVRPAAVSGFDWKTRVDIAYQDEMPISSVDNIAVLPDRTIVHFRSGLENGKYKVFFWVKNLFNDDNAIGAVAIPNPGNPLQAFNALVQGPQERTFGITGSIKF